MWNKRMTLMLIPHARGVLKQLRIPIVAIYLGIAVFAALLFGTLFFSAHFFSDKVTQNELERLRTENHELAAKFDKMRCTLAEVESRYKELVDKEIVIRSAFELPEIDVQERQLGVGGPVSPTVINMSPTRKVAYDTELELDRLLRLSEYELEKFRDVESSLLDLKDRLDHTPSVWPAKGWLSRGFGMKHDPFTGYERMHRGIDIANRIGTPIKATADGKVVKVGTEGGLGRIVVINHGYGFKTRYAHLSKAKVKVGQTVERGDVIATMGSTGWSTGPHLHYEVIRNNRALNPMKFILSET